MNKINSKKLITILGNKTSGSSELVQLLNEYFISANKSESRILKDIQIAKTKLRYFEVANKYLNNLKKSTNNPETLINFLNKYSNNHKNKIEIIFKNIYPHLKSINKVITLSRSGTVLEILKLLNEKNRRLRVIVCESRPKFEGRIFARDLANSGTKTELITDAMMSLFVTKADIALIGADVILKSKNVVNKVGSKSLALLCREYKKPLFVVTTKDKISQRNTFKSKKENPEEIFKSKSENLKVKNIYFEEVEKKLITKIFTD